MYTIDFSQAYYLRRHALLTVGGLAVLSCVAAVGMGLTRLYMLWSQPTLEQSLAKYQLVAARLNGIMEPWEDCQATFAEVEPYYGLLWSQSPYAVLERLADMSERLEQHDPSKPLLLSPLQCSLARKGQCKMKFRLRISELEKEDKQRGRAEAFLETALGVWDTTIEVGSRPSGKTDLPVTATFELVRPDHAGVPPIPPELTTASKTISDVRVGVRAFSLGSEVTNSVGASLRRLLEEARPSLGTNAAVLDAEFDRMLDPGGFMDTLQNALVGPAPPGLSKLHARWDDVATRRIRRIKELDNREFRENLKWLTALSDAELPGKAVFTNICLKARQLRDGVETNCYTEAQVFDPRSSESRAVLSTLCANGLGLRPVGIIPMDRVGPDANDRGLLLARWRLEFSPGSFSRRRVSTEGNSALYAISNLVRAIETNGAGFVVETVDLSFEEKRRNPGRSAVSELKIDGWLPYRTNETHIVQVAESEVR